MRLPWRERERVQLLPNQLQTEKLPWCRKARLVRVDGTGALRWESRGQMDDDDWYLSCLTLRGTPLLSRKDPGCPTCASLLAKAHDLGLEVLLEMHDERDLDYAALEPDMCGVNNRNLGTFVTDVHNSFAMAARLPAQAVKVSESGIGSPATVRRLRAAGYDGFLVGEQLMKQSNPGQALQQFTDAL